MQYILYIGHLNNLMCATSYERDARKQIYDSQRERDCREMPWENATKIKLVQK